MSGSEPFENSWWAEWELYVDQLRVGMKSNFTEAELRRLLLECRSLYEEHICVTSMKDVLTVISGYGCSALEVAFMWMGRWRPTTAVGLVYSTMGVDSKGMKIELQDIVTKGLMDSNPLSETQLSGLSTLQKHASDTESEISKQLALIQMRLVEQNTVAALRLGETGIVEAMEMSEFQQLIDAKLKELQEVLQKADMLRLHTLRVLLELLPPVQTASCIVAGYDLICALRSLSMTIQNFGG